MTTFGYTGIWQNTGGTIDFGPAVTGGSYTQQALIASAANASPISPRTLGLPTLSGPDAAFFSIDPTGFPYTITGPNSMGFLITFSPTAVRDYHATATTSFMVGGKPFFITFTLLGTGVAPGTLEIGFNLGSVAFPPDPIATPEPFPGNITINNQSNVPVTLTTLAFVTGTSFQIVGGPVLPFIIAAGGSSPTFQVQYTATVIGGETDQLVATITGGHTATMQLVGTGTQITPVFPLNGNLQQTLFGFSGEINACDPEDFNTEVPGAFTRLSDWNIPNVEKQMMRVRGHYQDYGPAVIEIFAQCRRVTKPADPATVVNTVVSVTVPIGTTGSTDGWIREFIGDIEITDELVQVSVSRAAGSGPAFIVDYTPCIETKGEVVEAT